MGYIDDDQDPETLDQQCEPPNSDPTLSDEDVASSRSETMYGPHPKLSRGDEIYNVQHEFKMVKDIKIVCSLDLLLQLFQTRCQTAGCVGVPAISHHFVGTAIVVYSTCTSGHKNRFCSSHELNNGLYVNNLQAAASLLLSGNNFGKE
jgi:hypothetical protein